MSKILFVATLALSLCLLTAPAQAQIQDVRVSSIADPTQGGAVILGLTQSGLGECAFDSWPAGATLYDAKGVRVTAWLAEIQTLIDLASGAYTAVTLGASNTVQTLDFQVLYPNDALFAGASVRGYLARSGGVTQHAMTLQLSINEGGSKVSFSAVGVLGGAGIGLINLVLKNLATGKVIKSANGALSSMTLPEGIYTVTATPVSVDAAGTALLIMGR
jgi:hypothetical protein